MPKIGLESDSSSEKDEVPLQSKLFGMIIPNGESPPTLFGLRLNTVACSPFPDAGVYGSSAMVDRNASRMSFFEFSSSGDVENLSVMPVGVQADEGSKDDATDSVTLAVDNRPVRMKLKSNVGAEFAVAVARVGVHDPGTEVGGEIVGFENRVRVSILGMGWAFLVGMALKLCSRRRIRFSCNL